jgi:hypothetical protein
MMDSTGEGQARSWLIAQYQDSNNPAFLRAAAQLRRDGDESDAVDLEEPGTVDFFARLRESASHKKKIGRPIMYQDQPHLLRMAQLIHSGVGLCQTNADQVEDVIPGSPRPAQKTCRFPKPRDD